MVKCPESLEELEELERLLPLCRKTLLETAKAKLESGAAYSISDAARQISEETGRPAESIRVEIHQQQKKEKDAQADKDVNGLQAPAPICSLWTRDQESFTPSEYVEAARDVMGSIDLDPASCEAAQEVIMAETYFTKEDDGLNQLWHGNVFLNPPYSHPEIKYFVDKLLNEIKNGRVKQAMLLTNNNTDTNFFHDAATIAAALCFTKGRINFLKPDGSTSSPTNGQVFYYFGNHKKKFVEIFRGFGILMEKVL
jgi:ParB family chromosome partitioning protein